MLAVFAGNKILPHYTTPCTPRPHDLPFISLSWNSMGPTPTRTLGMRLSCNFVNVYTIAYRYSTRVHACIPNEHPRKEKRKCRTSRRRSRRGSSCVSGSWQAEWGSRRRGCRCRCRCRSHGIPSLPSTSQWRDLTDHASFPDE